jgi:hypothetical protein
MNSQVIKRELDSTIMAIAKRLNISYDEALAVVRAVDVATQRLCTLWASWLLYHTVRRRYGDTAAVAAATAALILACGRTHKDALIECAERKCYTGRGIRDVDADNVADTTRTIAGILGYDVNDAMYLSGYLKYLFLQLLGITVIDDKLRGEGVYVGELIAYATQLMRL